MASKLQSTLTEIAAQYSAAKTSAKRRRAVWWQLSEVIAVLGDRVGYETLQPLLDLKDALEDVDRGHAPALLNRPKTASGKKKGGRPKKSTADEEILLRAASAATARAREKKSSPAAAAKWVVKELKARGVEFPSKSRKSDAEALEDWRQKLFNRTARPYLRNTYDVLSRGDSAAILDGLGRRWHALKPPAN